MNSASRFPRPRRLARRLLLAALSGFLGVASSAAARPLRIAYTHSFTCVPLGIAETQGFWRAAGLAVELRGYQTSQEVVAALRDGDVDIGFDQIATWVDEAVTGVPLVIVGETDSSNGGDKLLLRSGAQLPNLKGKPIAVCLRGSGQMLFLREALARDGLSLSDFPLAEVPEQEKALQLFAEGKLHVVVCNEPWATRLEQSGARVVATTADFPGIAPAGFAARRDRLKPALLQQFFTAWFRAVAFLHDPANAAVVAETASVYAFAGSETITPADVARFARSLPVHDAAAALRQNNPETGNLRLLVQRLRVLLRLQGRQLTEADLLAHFDVSPLRAVAGGGAVVVAAETRGTEAARSDLPPR